MDGSDKAHAIGAPTGRPTVINVWASWCGPCGKELPAFVGLAAAAGDRVNVVGVDTGDNPHSAVSVAHDLKMTFPSVYDPEQAVSRALKVVGIPATAFVTADGRVAHIYNSTPLTAAALRALVARYLGVTIPG